jgi:PAP2 superfamily
MAMTEAGGPHSTPDRIRHARSDAAVSAGYAVGGLGFRGAAASWIRNWASQDWIAVSYFITLIGALCLGKGPHRSECLERVVAFFGVYLIVLALVRGGVLRWSSAANSLLYRTAVIGTLLSTFFQLRLILPAVAPWAFDAQIYSFDLSVFGFEPSVWLDRFVSAATTEWFAFFYFLYFLILCVHILPMMYLSRDAHLLNRFATGALLMYLSSHIMYMLVPGYGPYWYLKGTFAHELTGGTFWPLVRETVEVGGAQKDIFPSLHTGSPLFFTIFCFRHRALRPFKYSWPITGFLTTQIVIATMFLRWHYLIDIVAGIALAFGCQFAGQYIADWERAKRERLGLLPAWMPLVYPWSRPSDE